MKNYYIYVQDGELIDYNQDPNQLAKQVAEYYFPEEIKNQIIELVIEDYSDSVYIEGLNVDLINEGNLYDIIEDCEYDISKLEYVETEFVGNAKYRAIFHYK